jgi:hypothetical protein
MSLNQNQNLVKDLGGAGNSLHVLMMHEGEKLLMDETDRAIEEIEKRATEIGSVLEGILHEAHGTARWGLNE